jgi:hypothetical protein
MDILKFSSEKVPRDDDTVSTIDCSYIDDEEYLIVDEIDLTGDPELIILDEEVIDLT